MKAITRREGGLRSIATGRRAPGLNQRTVSRLPFFGRAANRKWAKTIERPRIRFIGRPPILVLKKARATTPSRGADSLAPRWAGGSGGLPPTSVTRTR
jgi:hypothetical protein